MRFRDIKKSLIKTYDDLAVSWGGDETGNWGRENLNEFALVVKKSGGEKVLDLGCGSGFQSQMLEEEGLQVTGLDLSFNMVEEARRRVPNAKFVVGDMMNMDFEPDSFDGVYARASLLHLPKESIPQVLSSINVILKESGYLYLAVKEGNGEGIVRENRYGKDVERFFSFFQEDEIARLVQNAGFDLVEKTKFLRPGGSTTWIEVFAKKN